MRPRKFNYSYQMRLEDAIEPTSDQECLTSLLEVLTGNTYDV